MSEKYYIEFVVKASSWEEVVRIFADELGIEKEKRNTSDRDISGLFVVRISLDKDQLTQEFYEKMRNSSKLAIVDDSYSETFRETVLKEVAAVEVHLRKLLLLVNDVINDYYDYFSKTLAKDIAKKSEVVTSGDINAITSYLTLEEILAILGSDISTWNNKALTANDLLQLLEHADIQTIKKDLKKKIKTGIVWDSISKHILDGNTSWGDIKEDLYRLKEIRNKAAHFRVLTIADVKTAKSLSRSILTKTKKKQTISLVDLSRLRAETFKQFHDALYGAQGILAGLNKMSVDTAAFSKSFQSSIAASQALINATRPSITAAQVMAEAFKPSITASRVISELLAPYLYSNNPISQIPMERRVQSGKQQEENSTSDMKKDGKSDDK